MEISAASLDRLTPPEIGLLLIPGSPWELDPDELRAVDSYAEARGMAAADPELRRAYLQVCVTVADELRDRPAEAEDGYQASIVTRIRLARARGAAIDEVALFALDLLRGLYPSPEAFARSRPSDDPDVQSGANAEPAADPSADPTAASPIDQPAVPPIDPPAAPPADPQFHLLSEPVSEPGEPMYVAHRNAIAVCLAMCIVFFTIEDPAVAGTMAPWLEAAAGLRPENEWLSRWAGRWRSGRAD